MATGFGKKKKVRGLVYTKNQKPFLRWLPILRAKAGYSQISFAEACGMSQSQICRYEKQYIKPHYPTLKRMADVLKCEVEDLYAADADPREQVS